MARPGEYKDTSRLDKARADLQRELRASIDALSPGFEKALEEFIEAKTEEVLAGYQRRPFMFR